MEYDVVVVGSGASGLGAALTLGQRGRRVALVEQHQTIAPMLRRFKRDGYWCDPGLHYVGGLHPAGALAVIFRFLGFEDQVEATPLSSDGYDILYCGDADPFALPVGSSRIRAALKERFCASATAIDRYFERMADIRGTTPFLTFDLPYDAVVNKKPDDCESVATFLARHGAEEKLIRMLSRYGYLLYGLAGDECPLHLHAMVQCSFYDSAHTFPDGGDHVVQLFENGLRHVGVDILCGNPVRQLEIDHHRHITGVRLANGSVLACKDCICSVHPYLLLSLLPPGVVRGPYLRRIQALKNTYGVMSVYVSEHPPPARSRARNHYFLGAGSALGYDHESIVVMGGTDARRLALASTALFRPLPDSPFRSVSDKGQPRAGYDYEALKQVEVERTVELYRRWTGKRATAFEVLEAATPLTYERYTKAPSGPAYGLRHSSNLRARTPVGGLHLAGQSVLAPGLQGALISGILAAAPILGEESIWNELTECR